MVIDGLVPNTSLGASPSTPAHHWRASAWKVSAASRSVVAYSCTRKLSAAARWTPADSGLASAAAPVGYVRHRPDRPKHEQGHNCYSRGSPKHPDGGPARTHRRTANGVESESLKQWDPALQDVTAGRESLTRFPSRLVGRSVQSECNGVGPAGQSTDVLRSLL